MQFQVVIIITTQNMVYSILLHKLEHVIFEETIQSLLNIAHSASSLVACHPVSLSFGSVPAKFKIYWEEAQKLSEIVQCVIVHNLVLAHY